MRMFRVRAAWWKETDSPHVSSSRLPPVRLAFGRNELRAKKMGDRAMPTTTTATAVTTMALMSAGSFCAITGSPSSCLVCGNNERVIKSYGAMSCHGCKSFFRRSIRKRKQYICMHEENCVVEKSKGTRNCCRFCRLRKCREAGMSEENLRDTLDNKLHPVARGAVPPSLSPAGVHEEKKEKEKEEVEGMSLQSRALVDFLVAMTERCITYFDPKFGDLAEEDWKDLERHFDYSCTLAECLHDPSKLGPRWKFDFSCKRVVQVHDFALGWHRSFTYLADWANAIPEFCALSKEDRETLFRRNFIKLTLLFYGYYARFKCDKDFDKIPFGNGSYASCSNRNNMCVGQSSNKKIGGFRFAEISSTTMSAFRVMIAEPFEEMDVREGEYLLFKALCLFECREALSPAGKEVAEHYATRLMDALFEYQIELFPDKSALQRNVRYSQILMTTSKLIEAWRATENIHFALTTFGFLNLGGVMQELLHN